MWRRWIVSFGGAGLVPRAPGTAGSLAATVLLGLLLGAIGARGTAQPFWLWQAILLVGLVACTIISVLLGPWANQHWGRKDPQPFVLDEAAGICLTLLGQPMYRDWRQLAALATAFLAFRLFDIVKIPPARQLERLPGGWGILLDDLAAAVYANLLCQVALRLAWG